MKLKGIITVKPVEVKLDKYFDYPARVSVRPLSVPARARVQELTSSGVRYLTKQKGKGYDVDALEQALPADMMLDIRKIKLTDAFVDHNIQDEDGKTAAWGDDLWKALDDADARILEKVIDEINEVSYPSEEEKDSDPTSVKKSGTK